MATPDLTLTIGSKNYSSWSLRPWLALRLTGLPFTERVIDLKGPQRAEIASASPSGLVPCLTVARPGAPDLTVWDSLAICEYLAELAPDARLWPADSGMRAKARCIAAEMHSGFADLRRTCPMDIVHRYPDHAINLETRKNIDRIVHIWTECREAAKDHGDFLFGAFSIADCFYAPVVTRFHTYGVTLSGAAAEYAEAVRSWAALQEWTKAAGDEESARRPGAAC
jgi:glutathione S-transferase